MPRSIAAKYAGRSRPSFSIARNGKSLFARRRPRNWLRSGTSATGYGSRMFALPLTVRLRGVLHAVWRAVAEFGHDTRGGRRPFGPAPPRRARARRVAGGPHRGRPAHPAG